MFKLVHVLTDMQTLQLGSVMREYLFVCTYTCLCLGISPVEVIYKIASREPSFRNPSSSVLRANK